MTDTYGNLLHALDRAERELRAEAMGDTEAEDLMSRAQDIAAVARRWNHVDPTRAANLILESVFDDLYDGAAWRFLSAATHYHLADPKSIVRAQLEASVESLNHE